jgi:hypothetical protein
MEKKSLAMKNKITLALVSALLIQPIFSQAQTPKEESLSSVIWANGSGVHGLGFDLNGKTISNSWFPGANGGAGSNETTKWLASFKPPEPALGFSRALSVESGSSSVAVLVGDFQTITNEQLELLHPTAKQKTPTGYSKNSEKEFTRAALLNFPIQKDASETYPVHLVNGIPGSMVRVSFSDGRNFQLPYAVPEIYDSQVGVETHMGIQIDSHKEIAGFKLDPLERGGLLVFYRKAGDQTLQKMFVNLHSIESLEYRATHPAPEEE